MVDDIETEEAEKILTSLRQRYSQMVLLLTLGEKGALLDLPGKRYQQDALPAEIVDTTAAGDTFTGYFLSSYLKGEDPASALLKAATIRLPNRYSKTR